MTEADRKLGELKFTLLSNHMRGHLGPWDEKYRKMDVHEHLKDVLRYLVEWKAEATKIIREEYGNLQDHLAVVQMDCDQGKFNMEGLVNSEDYIAGLIEEAENLQRLLEINL